MSKKKETSIHALSHDGRGIATINDKVTFVSGALPEEKVTYTISKTKKNFAEAETECVLSSSKSRVEPICEHFGVCGGCSLQHMNTTTQHSFKLKTLLDQLKHFGNVVPIEIHPILASHSFGYRRKARLGVKFVYKKNKLLIGFREKSSRYLADIEKCKVLHPAIGERFELLKLLISSLESYQQIPQIEVAIGDTDIALIFRHLTDLSNYDEAKLLEFSIKENIHIYLQPNSPAEIKKLWPNDNKNELSYTLPNYKIEFLFHPLDFTQINLDINRLMIDQAIEWLNPDSNNHVLDLFCGIGNFTLPISKFCKFIDGVEGSNEMVERAYRNQQHNRIENANFYTKNLFNLQNNDTWMNNEYDIVILDPPRTGAKEIVTCIDRFNAKKILYISCNPATLARDAGQIVHKHGYHLSKIGMIDMFPHTSHIEAMALFEKVKNDNK